MKPDQIDEMKLKTKRLMTKTETKPTVMNKAVMTIEVESMKPKSMRMHNNKTNELNLQPNAANSINSDFFN